MKSFSLLVPLLLSTYAFAHGIFTEVRHNGQRLTFNGQNSPIMRVSTQDPNKGANNPALSCGPQARNARNNLDVNPGDTLEIGWGSPNFDNWPHNTGPMLTYMADCGQQTCDKFDFTKARWFKIDEAGRNNGVWEQAALMRGARANVRIPSNLAAGNYLLRHEIIALHLATQRGGSEFYPGCVQLRVGGSQTGKPNPADLVSFPGAYSDNDPGIFAPRIFDTNAPYQMPGPRVARLGEGAPSNNNGGSSTTRPAATSTRAASSTTTRAAATGKPRPTSGSCRLKKREPVDADTLEADEEIVVRRPRHIMRIMGRSAFQASMH